MYSTITNNIRVSVLPEYDVRNSFPSDNRFVFRYNVVIENLGNETVKLLKRKWLIYDVSYGFTEIIGDGVIGITPEIASGETFRYFSNVVLRSAVGNMCGSFIFENLVTEENLEAEIPKFNLMSEVLSN